MPDEIVIPPTDAPGPSTTPVEPNATPSTTQVATEPSSASTTQVEPSARPQATDGVRPFERIAGRKFDKLEKGMSQIMEVLQNLQKPTPSAPNATPQPVTPEQFLSDPVTVLNQILDERDKRIKGEIPETLSAQTRQLELKRSGQDALKMIETNELVRKDPEGIDRVEDILRDPQYGLEKIASTYPIEAARLALEIYSSKHKATPGVPTPSKAQMTSTATAVHAGTKTTIKDEAAELQKQMLANPSLMQDPEFIKKIQVLKSRRQADLVQ